MTPEWELDVSAIRRGLEPTPPPAPWSSWACNAVCAARKRARIKKWRFDLSADWVRKQLAAQDYKCALSGIAFREDKSGKSWKRPWRPSIDRIDASKGYTKDNVRLVCVAVNTLLHDWGDCVFYELMANR